MSLVPVITSPTFSFWRSFAHPNIAPPTSVQHNVSFPARHPSAKVTQTRAKPSGFMIVWIHNRLRQVHLLYSHEKTPFCYTKNKKLCNSAEEGGGGGRQSCLEQVDLHEPTPFTVVPLAPSDGEGRVRGERSLSTVPGCLLLSLRPSRLCDSTATSDHPQPDFAPWFLPASQHNYVRVRREAKCDSTFAGKCA